MIGTNRLRVHDAGSIDERFVLARGKGESFPNLAWENQSAEVNTEQQTKDEVQQSMKTEGTCKRERGWLLQELHEDHGMTDQQIADEFGMPQPRPKTRVNFSRLMLWQVRHPLPTST